MYNELFFPGLADLEWLALYYDRIQLDEKSSHMSSDWKHAPR